MSGGLGLHSYDCEVTDVCATLDESLCISESLLPHLANWATALNQERLQDEMGSGKYKAWGRRSSCPQPWTEELGTLGAVPSS